MRFGFSLYFCLIWARVLKYVFQNSNEAVKHLQSYLFFKKFIQRPSTESYIDGLCESLQSTAIDSPVKWPKPKRRLSEILYEEQTSSEDGSCVPFIKSRVCYADSEENGLPETPVLPVAEVSEKSSSSKKRIKRMIRNQRNISFK